MRRVSTYLLTGLAVFFLAMSVLLRFYVLPGLLVTPLDQFAESFAPGTGTVFDPATLTERTNVDMVAHRTLQGDVAASTTDRGVWDESSCCSDSSGKMINTTTDRVAWDRKTAEAINCCNENVDGTPTKHVGLCYKFPFGAEKKTYQFFDVTAKRAYPMSYKGSEKIQGLTVYRYEQPIAPVQVGEVEVPGDLVGEHRTVGEGTRVVRQQPHGLGRAGDRGHRQGLGRPAPDAPRRSRRRQGDPDQGHADLQREDPEAAGRPGQGRPVADRARRHLGTARSACSSR